MAETTTTSPATTAVVETAPAKSWYDGADAEIVGRLQTRGWDKLEPAKAALEAAKAHLAAEKYIGIPPEQLLRLPKDAADAEGWKAVYSKLGVPADAAAYEFEGLKFADGADVDDAFKTFVRDNAHRLNIPKDAAKALAGEFVKYLDTADKRETEQSQAALAAEHQKLDTDWGKNKDANLFVAKAAAEKLGIKPEAVKALEAQIGYAAVMNMFHSIGTRMGEASFIVNANPNAPGVLSQSQAVAKLAELKRDKLWGAKVLAGDYTAVQEYKGLTTIIAGEDDTDRSLALTGKSRRA